MADLLTPLFVANPFSAVRASFRRQSSVFDEAVEKLQIEGLGGVGSECTARVFSAACFVMHHRLSLPDKEVWSGPTSQELSDFLFDISDKQRKRLKRIADALIERGETLH